jgi:hypothetical protein
MLTVHYLLIIDCHTDVTQSLGDKANLKAKKKKTSLVGLNFMAKQTLTLYKNSLSFKSCLFIFSDLLNSGNKFIWMFADS